jgi:hypothetical protein
MPKVTCRCGHKMKVPADGPERIVCPECAAKIRVRRPDPLGGDGFVRFACPCGRRLKVRASGTAQAGKCPDCGRIVPIPGSTSNPAMPTAHPETPTEELSPDEIAMLDQWALGRLTPQAAGPLAAAPADPAKAKMEAGLRVCPRCGRPVHMGSVVCRECGAHVPKR